VTPREQSGAETAERYEYQLHWAMRELLRRHQAGKNYCMLLEYFDDVVMLDDDVDPQHVDFYQVKTKRSGHWTITELTKRGGKDKSELSPIGKMYAHRLSFPDASIALHFLSNVPLKATLADGSSADAHSAVSCNALPQKDADRLANAVRTEHALGNDTAVDLREITAFLFCEFGPAAAQKHVVGELESFMEALFPHRKVRTTAVYRAILAELRRRNNCRERPASFATLIELHGMTRREFQGLMQKAGVHDDPVADWHAVATRITQESWPVAEQMRVSAAWRRYLAERTNHEDRQLQHFRTEVRRSVAACRARDDLTLRELVTEMLRPVRARPALTAGYTHDFQTAAVLAEFMTSYPEQDELSTTDTPSATEDETRVDDSGEGQRDVDRTTAADDDGSAQ